MKEKKFNVSDLLVFLELFGFIFSIILSKEVNNLDELWHFNIARQISKGLIPYNEISLITTPFFPFITSFFLKGPFDELIVYRVICSIFYTILFFLIYKIFIKIIKNIPVSLIFSNVLAFLMKGNMLFEYNAMCILLTLAIILIELNLIEEKDDSLIIDSKIEKNINNINSENKKSQKLLMKNFWIGILAGLAFLTKQTIGTFVIFAILFLKIVEIINLKIKENLSKNNEKELVARFLGIIIPILIFGIYLICKKSFSDFVSYCFLGINTFSNKKSYKILLRSSDSIIKILSYAMPIILLLEGISICDLLIIQKGKSKKNSIDTDKNGNKLLLANDSKKVDWNSTIKKLAIVYYYSLFMLLIEYPIADTEHFIKANLILIISALICLFYIIELWLKKIKINERVKSTIIGLFLGLTIFLTVFETGNYFLNYSKQDKSYSLNHFKNLSVSKSLYNQLNKIRNVIEISNGKQVYILDSNAVVFDIALDRYFKNYDMFNNGNFGKDSSHGIIQGIENSNNDIYLVKSDEKDLNWQTPKDVIEYIKNNLIKVGDCGIYEVYIKQ